MQTVYQANDGKVFDDKEGCKVHENQLKMNNARAKLIGYCSEMARKSNIDNYNAVSVSMADYMIENVKKFALAMAPFLPGDKGRAVAPGDFNI